MNREQQLDKLIATYFEQLWNSPTYLDALGQLMKGHFSLQKHWNQQLEQWLSFWQLPNQQLQQRTLHQVNTLLSEWRFEQEELLTRLTRIEAELQALKQHAAPPDEVGTAGEPSPNLRQKDQP